MTELTLSERLRVAAAINGPLTLELTHGQASELIRICGNMEANAENFDASIARLNAITARHEWLCRMNDEAIAPIVRLVLLLSGSSVVVGIAKDLIN